MGFHLEIIPTELIWFFERRNPFEIKGIEASVELALLKNECSLKAIFTQRSESFRAKNANYLYL